MRSRSFLVLVAAIAFCAASGEFLDAQGQGKSSRSASNRGFEPADDAQVDAAIRKANGFLRSILPQTTEHLQATLATLALLKSGLKASETPELQPVLNKITSLVKNGTFMPLNTHLDIYESGVSIMALGTADPKKYKPEIQAIAEYIISKQGPNGDWDYDSGKHVTGDTSISQYAVLGLWEASRAGIPIPGKVWDMAAAWHISRQHPSGAFVYHPGDPHGGEFTQPTHTMTAAGVGTLQIVRLHLYPDAHDLQAEREARKKRGVKYGILEPLAIEEDDPDAGGGKVARPDSYTPQTRLATLDSSLNRAIRWLGANYSITPETNWQFYYLYTLERMATLTGLEAIKGHDWYAEGTAFLVANQQADGHWTGDGCGPDGSTSLSSLFLGRATIKMLKRKPKPRFGSGILKGGRDLPENLAALTSDNGNLKVKKMEGGIDSLLAELEKLDSINLESAQAGVQENIPLGNPEALIGQKPRLLKLAKDPRPAVRKTAFWALGRTDDVRVAPVLIEAVASDPDGDCMVEAHNALRFLSRRIAGQTLPEEISSELRASLAASWRKWYLLSRPYAERDDIPGSK